MITCCTEVRDGLTVARLEGCLQSLEAADDVAERLRVAASGQPLVIDLTTLTSVEGPAVRELVLRLAARPEHRATVLVHADLEARRRLRAQTARLPVLPDVDRIVREHLTAALPADPSPA